MPGVEQRSQTTNTYHGYVVEDKANDSRTIKVYSQELLPTYQKELRPMTNVDVITCDWFSGMITSCNYIEAEYKDEQANRPMPPDVRVGEQVLIFNMADTNTWYWKSEGRNDDARRTEEVRMDASGTDNVESKTDDNTYFMEIDTREKKRIRMSTSQSENTGEKSRYLIEANAAAGTIFMGDAEDNNIYTNTGRKFVGMSNNDKSQMQIDGKNIILACAGDFRVIAGGAITFESGKDMLIHSNQKMTLLAKQDLNVITAQNLKKLISKDSLEQISGNSVRSISKSEIVSAESVTYTVSRMMVM